MTQTSSPYTRMNPFLASIKERYSLCKPGSNKNTQHIVLDLKGSDITYNVGDSIGIHPHNDPQLVEMTLQAMKATGEEIILDKHGEHSWKLRDFLTTKGSITEVSKKFLQELCYRQTSPAKKAHLEELHTEENKEALKTYIASHELWDLLLAHEEVVFAPQELCNFLMPLLPRLYSISSAFQAVDNEVHLTVAKVEYQTNTQQRRGVCTHYLCQLAPMNKSVVPVYIQPHHGFTLPDNHNIPIIMIGPGTGVAPFRAFMQARLAMNASGQNWLFFGEWNRSQHFFYEEFWQNLADQGKLRLDLAFSRDQENKIYVQHRMLEQGSALFQWLEDGAHLYVCGDAHRMAKDVEAALFQIIQTHGQKDETEAKNYIKRLRSEKRYLRDVY